MLTLRIRNHRVDVFYVFYVFYVFFYVFLPRDFLRDLTLLLVLRFLVLPPTNLLIFPIIPIIYIYNIKNNIYIIFYFWWFTKYLIAIPFFLFVLFLRDLLRFLRDFLLLGLLLRLPPPFSRSSSVVSILICPIKLLLLALLFLNSSLQVIN